MNRIRLILILAMLANAALAQVYVSLSTGYSWATKPSAHLNQVVADSMMNMFYVKFPYGKGLNIALGLGYTFSEHISAELHVSTALLTTSKSNNDWEEYFTEDYERLYLSGLNGDVTMKNNSIQISPLLVYSIHVGSFQPFLKAGFNLLYTKSIYENNYTYLVLSEGLGWYLEHTEVKRAYSGGWNLGFRGSLGVLFDLSEKLQLYGECMAVNTHYLYKTSDNLTYKVNGEDKLDELEENPVKLKNDEGLVDYSNIGLNFGIRYRIGKDQQ